MNEGLTATGQFSSKKLISISLLGTAGGGNSSHQQLNAPMSRLPALSIVDRLPPQQQSTTVFRPHQPASHQNSQATGRQPPHYADSSPLQSSTGSPDRKRIKLEVSEAGSNGGGSNSSSSGGVDDLTALKRRILEHKYMRLRSVKEKYSEHVSELFYLQQGGSMMDYPTWRKKPQSSQFIAFNRQHRLDQSQLDEMSVSFFHTKLILCFQ